MIALVLLTPIIGLGLILLLEHVERWAFDNHDLVIAARPRAAGARPAPTRSSAAARNVP